MWMQFMTMTICLFKNMENSFIYDMGEQEAAHVETGLSFELKNLISISKADIKEKVDAVVVTIQDGWTDPLDALILAKKGVELFSSLEKNVRCYAEAKQVSKGYSKHGTKISEAMAGVKYDYSTCNDPEWNELSKKAEEAKKELSKREEFLKAVTKDIEVVDVDTGATHTLKPPVKTGKLGLKLEIQ